MKKRRRHTHTAIERGGNTLNAFKHFRTENGSIQGQNLALTGLCVPMGQERGEIRAGWERGGNCGCGTESGRLVFKAHRRV